MNTLLHSIEAKVNDSLLNEFFEGVDTSMYSEVCFYDLSMRILSRGRYSVEPIFDVVNEEEEEKRIVFKYTTNDSELFDAYKYGYEDYYESEEDMVRSMMGNIDLYFEEEEEEELI